MCQSHFRTSRAKQGGGLSSVTAPQPQSPQARAVAVGHTPEENVQLVRDVWNEWLRGTCWSQMASGTALGEEVRVGTNRNGIKIISTALRAE